MKNWTFDNGIEVYESEFDYDLHCLKVYNGDNYLGTVYPDSIEDMKSCFKDLDAGNDPITGGWEDGMGNSCTLDGWGDGTAIEDEEIEDEKPSVFKEVEKIKSEQKTQSTNQGHNHEKSPQKKDISDALE